jgi:hypothetical protein
MPGSPVDVGYGTTVVFGTSAFSAELLSVDWGGISREAIDVTHMGSGAPGAGVFGNMEFIPNDISDPGELTMEIHFNPDTLPPIDAVAETVTVTFPLFAGDTTPADWEGSGFVTSYEPTVPHDDKMTATMTVKFSGNITRTAAI